MARIHSKDTKPEHVVRKALHASGYRYRLHVRSLPGRPDIVMRKYNCAIFVHGCFWHGHAGCPNFRIPKTRPEFWEAKIEANRARDGRAVEALLNAGWRVLVVWECATRTYQTSKLVSVITAWLQSPETSDELSSEGLSGGRTLESGIVPGEQETQR